jgi:hypothetical protein
MQRFETTDTVILGGGLIGHLAAILFPEARVFDRRVEPAGFDVTHQPGAHYLWAPLEGLENDEIRVLTRIDNRVATPESIAAYKAKVAEPLPSSTRANGEASYRLHQFDPEMSGWRAKLPPVTVEWNRAVKLIDPADRIIVLEDRSVHYGRLINTIPLKAFCSMLIGHPFPQMEELVNRPIYVETLKYSAPPFDFGPMETLYVDYITNPTAPYYRETHQADGTVQREALRAYTQPMFYVQPGKLVAHDAVPDTLAMLAGYHTYSFGHYGTWDPDELTHHTWEKLRQFAAAIDNEPSMGDLQRIADAGDE